MPDLDDLENIVTRNFGLELLSNHLDDLYEDPEWLDQYDFTADL